MKFEKDFFNPFLAIDEKSSSLLPLNLFISFQESQIDLIPSIRENAEVLAGLDGDITYESTYSPRLFDLQCYTPDGLSAEQKILYKQHITYTLNQLKESAQPLLYQGRIYMVRVSSSIQPSNFAGWFNSSIQLKASDPFGYSQKVYILKGNGTIRYNGNVGVGFVVELKGAVTNPYVTVNGMKISYSGTVPLGATLCIDTQSQQAFLSSGDGVSVNVIGKILGLEKKVQLKTATTQIVNNVIEYEPYKNAVTVSHPEYTTIKWREKFL